MLFNTKALVVTIALALTHAAAAPIDEVLAIEALLNDPDLMEESEATIIEEIEEKLDWANRATGPDVRGWFKGDTYQAKSRREKMADLWGQIEGDSSVTQPVTPLMWANFDEMLKQKANGSFCQVSDEMKRTVKKTTHTQGVVAQIAWESTGDHPYTGIYASGTEHGIMRFSETTNLHEKSTGLLPSMAIKFLRDGVESCNLFAMPQFTQTDSWNFFKLPLRNRLQGFTMEDNPVEWETIRKKLVEGSARPFATAIGHIGKSNLDGTDLVDDDVFVPYELWYTSPFQFSDEPEMVDGEQVMFYDQLKTIPVGATILEVWAITAPVADQFDTERVKIADVKLLSPLITSTFADTRLFFQHKRVQRDRKYWTRAMRKFNEDQFFD